MRAQAELRPWNVFCDVESKNAAPLRSDHDLYFEICISGDYLGTNLQTVHAQPGWIPVASAACFGRVPTRGIANELSHQTNKAKQNAQMKNRYNVFSLSLNGVILFGHHRHVEEANVIVIDW